MENTTRKYVVDTNVLVNLMELPNNDKLRPKMEKLINNGKLRTLSEVFCELRKFPNHLIWYKQFKSKMAINSKAQYSEAVTKFLGPIENKCKNLIDWTVLGPCEPADPWLIAVAKAFSFTVVTDERKIGPKRTRRIPFVCDNLNVRCMGLNEFIKEAL